MHQLQYQLLCKTKKMILMIVSCITLLGHLTTAVPLESPAANLTQYFDSRIVGGSVAPKGSSPWMVALLVGGHFICGGSIITRRHVMTAAHCIIAFVDWHGNLLSTFYGVVGTLTWNKGGVIVTFITYDNHPGYNPSSLKNDLGLLTMDKELKFSALIQPVRLYKGTVAGREPCYVTGWGTERLWGDVPKHLQILYMHTISEQECLKLIASVSGPWPAPSMDNKVEICTFHSPGHGMCHGDSGSGLILIEVGEQIGIVSWGFPCAVGGPDVFVRVQPYYWFIKSIVGGYFI